jgi:hypothetical protein
LEQKLAPLRVRSNVLANPAPVHKKAAPELPTPEPPSEEENQRVESRKKTAQVPEKKIPPQAEDPDELSFDEFSEFSAKQRTKSKPKPLSREGTETLQRAASLQSLACSLSAEGTYHEAEEAFSQCLTLYEVVYGQAHVEIIPAMENLAWVFTITHR